MLTDTKPARQRASAPSVQRPRIYRLSVEQYEKMAEVGILKDGDRAELLEGLLVEKMSQHPPHASSIERADDALQAVLPAGWRVRDQKPIRLRDSLPEPDLVVAKGDVGTYDHRHPGPADIALVVEAADSSLAEDRTEKARIYARARLPVYWIINLVDGTVEVYTQPRSGKSPSYQQSVVYRDTESVPLILAGQEVARIPVSQLFPSRVGP